VTRNQNFRIEELDGEPKIIAGVEHGMRRMGEVEARIPYVRYFLGVDPGDPAILAMDASARRKRMSDALPALTLRGVKLGPVVLAFARDSWRPRPPPTARRRLGCCLTTAGAGRQARGPPSARATPAAGGGGEGARGPSGRLIPRRRRAPR
jgi:hypothetical protein